MEKDAFRPIRIFAYVLLIILVVDIYLFIAVYLDKESSSYIFGSTPPPIVLIYMGTFMAIFDIFVVIGVIFKYRWGYYMFKVNLYLWLLFFPIGTIVSYMYLSYIKRNNIKKYFGYNNIPSV